MPEITKSAEQIERERLTRRQALRKLGFGAGLSAFMLLGVDDLARMVGAKMQQMAGDNQVANQVAEEFQNAGVAFAGGPSWANCDGSYGIGGDGLAGYGGACVDNCVAGPFEYCQNCTYPCTGAVLRWVDCGFQHTTADCEACCRAHHTLGDIQVCIVSSACDKISMHMP